jgi:hypothetical protein
MNVIDMRACYIYAMIQKYLLNDMDQYETYLAKMNGQREMMKLL